jgi:hypothetical protein
MALLLFGSFSHFLRQSQFICTVEYSSDVRILDYTKSKIGPLNLVCRCLVTVGRVNKFVMESEFIDAQVQAPNVLRDLMISRVRIYKIVKHYSIRLLGDFFSHVSIVHERHITVPPPPWPSYPQSVRRLFI